MFRVSADMFKLLSQILQLLIAEILQIHQVRSRPLHTPNQFIEFQMNRLGVAILRILDQEHN